MTTRALLSRRISFAALGLSLLACLMLAWPEAVFAQTVSAPDLAPGLTDAFDRAIGSAGTGTADIESAAPLSLSLQLLLLMGLLTMLPAIVLMMTSFTRVLIVLSILRQALGLQQSPPNQVLVGLALFLSFFIMAPTLDAVNAQAIVPYAANTLSGEEAIAAASEQMRVFMMAQTREANLAMFADIAEAGPFAAQEDVPLSILLPAFVTSELQTAFQIGFMLFLPFLVIDLVVASVLMSLGMMMLSPTIISLPFKLLLFVLVDGWALLMGSLAMSFS